MIEVVDYDPAWPLAFEAIRERVLAAVSGVALAVEHVGSTSVPGLAAKPIVDVDVVVTRDRIAEAITRLCAIGYSHQGDLGIAGREAFRAPGDLPRHNLYVCEDGCLPLHNHLAVRDRLRADPVMARAYGELKRRLAARFPDDIEAYIDGKSELLAGILADAGLSGDEVACIRTVNTPVAKREG